MYFSLTSFVLLGAATLPGAFASPVERACCTATICDGTGGSGSCYSGCYPFSVEVFPDTYWQQHIGTFSVPSGQGCQCFALTSSDATCNTQSDGTLVSACVNNVEKFYCTPQ